MIPQVLDPMPTEQHNQMKKTTIQAAKTIRFLIAHENRNIRKFIRGCLQGMENFDVVEWIPGQALLGTLLDEKPDVLIANGETPEMGAWKLVKTLRSLPGLKKTKVIIVSGDSCKEIIEEAIQAGVDDYIILPFSATLLEKRIEALFAERSKERRNRIPWVSQIPSFATEFLR